MKKRLLDVNAIVTTCRSLRCMGFITLSGACQGSNSSSQKKKDWKLIGSQVYFRHGARAPLFELRSRHLPPVNWRVLQEKWPDYVIAPFKVYDETSNQLHVRPEVRGPGVHPKLTYTGYEDMFVFGRKLRQRYIEQFQIVSPVYDPTNIFLRSTPLGRNIYSVKSVAAGLFTDCSRLQLSSSADHFKIYTRVRRDDLLSLNPMRNDFMAYNIVTNSVYEEHPEILEFRDRLIELFDVKCVIDMYNKKEIKCDNVDIRLYYLCDTLLCRMHHNLPVPKEVPKLLSYIDWYASLEMIGFIVNEAGILDPMDLAYSIGDTCQYILEIIDRQIADPESQKLCLFAVHDTTLAVLLSALSLLDGRIPRFGADLTFELYESCEGEHWIQVFYCEKLVMESPLSEWRKPLERLTATDAKYDGRCSEMAE